MQSLEITEGSLTMIFSLGVSESNFDTQAHHDFFFLSLEQSKRQKIVKRNSVLSNYDKPGSLPG